MIKQFLNNHYNIDRLYSSYLINTDNIVLSLEELQDFIQTNLLNNGQLEQNPDYHFVQKLDNITKNISVDQIRQLQSFLYQTSVISGKKIAIIYAADQMNLNAANSCLKILEDTPANTYLFLLTENAASILPTIRSRCAKINHHYDESSKYNIDERFIKPLLKTSSVADKLSFVKEFSLKDRNLWADFAASAEALLAKFCRKMIMGSEISVLEKQLLAQFKSNSLQYLQDKYEKIKDLIDNTNKFDLDLSSSCLLLIEQFRK